jgi:hypothetical protein
MNEAGRLLHTILGAGDLVGRDPAGRMVIRLAVHPRDFERLMALGADAVQGDDGGAVLRLSSCWFWEAAHSCIGAPP